MKKLKNWITIVSAIGTLSVGIGTFWTIGIIRNQNKLTIKPELLINDEKMLLIINGYWSNVYFYSSNGNIDTSCFSMYHSNTDNRISIIPKTNTFHFNLVNVGLGVAKNISFLWSFDTLKYLHRFDTIKVPILDSIKYEPKYNEFIVYSRKDTTYYRDINEIYWHGYGIQDKFNFLLPYSNSKETLACKIPDLYLKLFSLHEVVFNQLSYPTHFLETCKEDFPALFLTIKYSDIGNNNFSIIYKIKIEELLGVGELSENSIFVEKMKVSFTREPLSIALCPIFVRYFIIFLYTYFIIL